MMQSMKQYVSTCDMCQKSKPRPNGPRACMLPIPIPGWPLKVVTVDFITDLPISNSFDAVLVIIDKLTRYAHFIPCTTQITEVETAPLFHNHIWSHYGLPQQIISDRDARWTGAFWDHLTKLIAITRSLTTALHPEADGQTEIMNQILEIALRVFINPKKATGVCSVLDLLMHTTLPFTLLPSNHQRGDLLCPANLLSGMSKYVQQPINESEAAVQFAESMKAVRNQAKDAIKLAQTHQQKSYNT